MLFSFVIVNYNTCDLLKQCVQNLLKLKHEIDSCEIIVVDNQSFDGSPEMLEAEFGNNVILIKNSVNSLPIAHNLGYERSTGDFIIHLGSDCYPTAEALLKLKDYCVNNNQVGICTGKIVNKNGEIDWDAHRGELTPWSTFCHFASLDRCFPKSKVFNEYFMGYMDMNTTHEIKACISHFMFIPRKTYELAGLWDNEYFMYGEDLDFCYRVREKGLKIMYVPSVEILHLKGGGVGRKTTAELDNASKSDYKHMKKVRQETSRAMLLFYEKHLAHKYPKIINKTVYAGIKLVRKFRSIMFTLKGKAY